MTTKEQLLEESKIKLRVQKLEWYHRNKEQVKKRKENRKNKNKRFIQDYKKEHSCEMCGENRWYCLDFHHKNSEEKSHGIADMVAQAYALESILKEIKKCILVCANCHRELHHGAVVK